MKLLAVETAPVNQLCGSHCIMFETGVGVSQLPRFCQSCRADPQILGVARTLSRVDDHPAVGRNADEVLVEAIPVTFVPLEEHCRGTTEKINTVESALLG